MGSETKEFGLRGVWLLYTNKFAQRFFQLHVYLDSLSQSGQLLKMILM